MFVHVDEKWSQQRKKRKVLIFHTGVQTNLSHGVFRSIAAPGFTRIKDFISRGVSDMSAPALVRQLRTGQLSSLCLMQHQLTTPSVSERVCRYAPRSHGDPHLEFALGEPHAELRDALGGDGVAVRFVLGHLVLQGDEADGGTLLLLQAEELQDALVVVHVAVDEDEQDLDGDETKRSESDCVLEI